MLFVHKGTANRAKYKEKSKNFGSSRKSSTFAPAKQKQRVLEQDILGYGVMVTLQILVLPFLVRVRVPQPKETLSKMLSAFCFYTPKKNR